MSAPLRAEWSYPPSHPWYYLLGAPVLPPKAILFQVRFAGYRGYRYEEIERAANLAEPVRTRQLERLHSEFISEVKRDLSRYRECANALRRHRRAQSGRVGQCEHVHTNLSLKYCHLFNGLAHLEAMSALPRQQDLFG